MKQIGFIGFGEAAYSMSSGLGGEGIQGILAYDAMQKDDHLGEVIAERAQKAGVHLLDSLDEVVSQSDIIFCSVPTNHAISVAKDCVDLLRDDQYYVDITSSAPTIKEEIGQLIAPSGALFVDIAMLGPLPQRKHKVPMVACGPGSTQLIVDLKPAAMNIQDLGPRVGAAAAVKLMRSVYMKGVASLMIEMLLGAESYGIAPQVIDSVADTMDHDSFKDTLNRLVTGSAIHYKRRAHELDGSIDMLETNQIPATLTKATKQVLLRLEVLARDETNPPTEWSDVITPLLHHIRG